MQATISRYMRKIPTSIKDHISNARYYLEAGDKFPSPTRDAVLILLLLTAWENIQIAKEELSAWAQKDIPSKKLYRDHAHKFGKASSLITRVILGPQGTPAKTETYSSGADFKRLLSLCRYGYKGDSRQLDSIFKRGWHLNSFRNSLIRRIEREEMMINIYEGLSSPRPTYLKIAPRLTPKKRLY